MNKEMLEQVLPIVEKTKEGLLKGIDIIYQELPELINQILIWEFSIGIIGILVGLLIFGFILFTVKIKNFWKDGEIFVLGNLFFWLSLIKVIKIYVAPKLYLLN